MDVRRHPLRRPLAAPPHPVPFAAGAPSGFDAALRRVRRVCAAVVVVAAILPSRAIAADRADAGGARSLDTWEEGRERWPLDGAPSRHETWLTVGGFVRAPDGGWPEAREIGVLAVVGAAFDRIAARASRPPAKHDAVRADLAALVPDVRARPAPDLPITRDVARRAVSAAWRAAALGADDARIDAMVSRARWSAALPETRLRAMRVFDDGASPDSAGTSTYYGSRGNLWLEARLTWRFDHLLYADDEPALERVRIDRLDARQRIATRVLALLAAWQRAWADARAAPIDSPDALDAALRASEAETGLDVLTGGWFGAWAEGVRREVRPRDSPSAGSAPPRPGS